MDTSITVTRQQLYADVWTRPVRTVASRLGISDVGLAKLLRRHRIPVPGRGYWQLLRAGRPPRKPPLPKTRTGETEDRPSKPLGIVSVSTDHPSATTTVALEESIQFCIEEAVRQVAHVPTAEEKRRAAASYWDRPPRFDYVPTNSLQLRILNARSLGARQTWADGKKQRLEALLGEFVVTLPGVAAAMKAERARQEERKRQWQVEERLRAERERLRYQEEMKARELERQAEQWRKAQRLREYVAAMKQAGSVELSTGLGIDNLADWIAWAERFVERVNPLGPRAEVTPP